MGWLADAIQAKGAKSRLTGGTSHAERWKDTSDEEPDQELEMGLYALGC